MNVQASVQRKLRSFRNRVRAFIAAEGLSRVALIIAGLVCVSVLLDYTQRLSFAARTFSLVVGLSIAGYVLHRTLLSRLARPMDDARMALTVEDRFPELGDRLISSLQFARMMESGASDRSGQSAAMMSAVAAEAALAVEPINPCRTLDAGRVLRAMGLAALAWAVLVAAAVVGPAAATIWLLRNVALQDVSWPQRTTLHVEFQQPVPRGDALKVTVEAGGQLIPDSVWIQYEFRGSGRRGREKLARIGGRGRHRFETRFKNVVEPLRFRVSGGDARTEWYRVDLVERPAVTTLKLQAVYPRYTAKPTAELDTSVSYLDVPAGTTLWARIIPSKPLQTARLVLDDGAETVDMAPAEFGPAEDAGAESWRRLAFWLDGKQRERLAADVAAGKCANELWLASLPITADRSVAIRLLDADDLENRPPTRFSVRIVPDKEPAVTLRTLGIGQMVVPNATVPLRITAEDDYGVRKLFLRHRVRLGDEKDIEDEDTTSFRLRYGDRKISHDMPWSLESVGLVPGSVLVFHAGALDYKDVGPENVGRSSEMSLRVVTPDELMAALVRRQIDQRQGFGRVRDRQRDEIKIELDAAARADGALTGDQKARLLAAEQTLRHSVEELKTVAEVCDQILQEMINNKLGDETERSRLRDGVVGPTRRLAERSMPALADGMRAMGAAADAARLTAENERILKEMDRVLAQMLKMETYRRIVDQARKLHKDQEELLKAIEEAHKKLIESILDPK